ncbi:type II secretion system protein GspM [Pseudocolwellia sp. HL-MZ19]|uniref:type II secretion system protein GspM n=1 Tax=unclassified Pseudocolwellia TaxID=2848178 RepID=UPI003CF7E125
MKERWLELNIREQRLVIAMGSVVLFFILYSAIWAPLTNNIEAATKKVERQQELLTWIQKSTVIYKSAAGANASNNRNTSLSSLVNQTAGRNNIEIARMQPQGESIQVWIDEVPFDNLLNWLEHLSQKEGVKVKAIDIAHAEQAGVVKVRRLQLGRS